MRVPRDGGLCARVVSGGAGEDFDRGVEEATWVTTRLMRGGCGGTCAAYAEQHHHSVVLCALGWACWKTYAGRPEENFSRIDAMTELGNALETVREPHGRVDCENGSVVYAAARYASEDQRLSRWAILRIRIKSLGGGQKP